MDYSSTPLEAYDVEIAHEIATYELADYRHCLEEYGPNHPVTKEALEAAVKSYRYALEVEAKVRGAP
jgi:hypothetical protein